MDYVQCLQDINTGTGTVVKSNFNLVTTSPNPYKPCQLLNPKIEAQFYSLLYIEYIYLPCFDFKKYLSQQKLNNVHAHKIIEDSVTNWTQRRPSFLEQ